MDIEKNGAFQVPHAGHNIQMCVTHRAGARTIHVEGNSMQENISQEQQANNQTNMRHASDNISEETHSLNFSFGVKSNSMIITPHTPCLMQDMTRSGKPTEESGHDEQQRKEQENQRQQFKGKEVQVGLSKQANDQLQDSNKQGEANRFQ
ncbi:hypothetical protein KY290_036530 [Solanum tuberosum]|uniref:Uncharacterized protein n=1 Tax=Solanum tuberosum TaxID=4113 RepID=A0ABQ7TWP2_SOLTU|nr:hypothetical protein KY289_036018 [Solanum tuberosum]KAH0639251.1 hypothetical protein KY285_035837 [Solanum tuberosum]KAH0680865.1 hypothetical protein KY284_021950 [Solanum tuberosum]KAH0737825.1 hypothetical protein KY290_036530 [Solanum tuberosum]